MRHFVIVFVVCALATIFASMSCNYPSGTCHPLRMNGKVFSDGLADPACTACLENRCCDVSGRCEEETDCTGAVAKAHSCVVEAGVRGGEREPACIASLGRGTRAASAYGCMRAECGQACGLPVCQVDPAAILFVSPTCDSCVTGACCRDVNACYANRSCKLALECIVDECATPLAGEFRRGRNRDLARATDIVCGDNPAAIVDEKLFDPNSCILQCLSTYFVGRNDIRGGATASAACEAFKVYACASRADCADACTIDASTGNAQDAATD